MSHATRKRGAPDYTTYRGKTPILSGGRVLTGWLPYKDKVLQCAPAGKWAGQWHFFQLFYHGKCQLRAHAELRSAESSAGRLGHHGSPSPFADSRSWAESVTDLDRHLGLVPVLARVRRVPEQESSLLGAKRDVEMHERTAIPLSGPADVQHRFVP